MLLHITTGVYFLQYTEKFHLLFPRVWQGGVEFGQGKCPWGFPGKDGIHYWRCEQGKAQKTANVGCVNAQCFSQGFRGIVFALVQQLLPAVGSGDAGGERLIDFQVFIRHFRKEYPLAAVIITELNRYPDAGVAVFQGFNRGLHNQVPPISVQLRLCGCQGQGDLRKALPFSAASASGGCVLPETSHPTAA